MALATYTDLQTSVISWLHRTGDTDIAAVVPDWIALAENRINGDLDARLQDTVLTLSTVASTATVAVPTDVVNIRSLVALSSPNMVLDYLTPDQFNQQYAFGDTGTPRMFTVIGSNIYLGPTPDAIYSLQCVYKAKVPALSSGSPTNWLLTNFPQVYLFATLCSSVMYTRDESTIPAWETLYREAINSVNSQDWFSGATPRVRSDVKL
jgi:hypothetical protein